MLISKSRSIELSHLRSETPIAETRFRLSMNERLSGLSSTARAFATYSLVPYLGIVFCPGAVVVGSLGVIRSYRAAEEIDHSGRTVCLLSLIVGIVVLIIQLLLWWIMYKVPTWSQGNIG